MKRDRTPAHRHLNFAGVRLVLLMAALAAAGCTTSSVPGGNDIATAEDVNESPAVSPTPDISPTPTPSPQIASEMPEFDAEAWLAERAGRGETHAMIVATMEPGRTIARAHPDTVINPASVVKLSTSLVALNVLGADHRFDINIYADGTLRSGGVFKGDLYFSGSDPVFTGASSRAVAEALAERGIKRVDGKIFVSPDFSYDFSAFPAESAKLLAKNLGLEKIPKTAVADDAQGTEIFTYRSQPLYRILLYQNTFSSNFVAHRIGEKIGGVERIRRYLIEELGLSASEVKLETTSGLKNNGMTARGIFAVIRELDKELKRQDHEPVDILPIAAEQTSTLARRLSSSRFERAVIGKTGTLSARDGGPGIASLAGIIYTEDSGPLVFVLLSQGREVWKHKSKHDELLKLALDGNAEPKVFDIALPRNLLQTSETSIVPGSDLKKEGG